MNQTWRWATVVMAFGAGAALGDASDAGAPSAAAPVDAEFVRVVSPTTGLRVREVHAHLLGTIDATLGYLEKRDALRDTEGAKHAARSLRQLVELQARLGEALRAEGTPAGLLARLEADDATVHPLVTRELEELRRQVRLVDLTLEPHLRDVRVELDTLRTFESAVDVLADEVAIFEATPPGKRRAALKKVDLPRLQGQVSGLVEALAGPNTANRVLHQLLRVADRPELASGTLAPNGQDFVRFDDDERTFRRYRFIMNVEVRHHAALGVTLAGTLLLMKAALVQQRWATIAPVVGELLRQQVQARYDGDPLDAVWLVRHVVSDPPTNRKLPRDTARGVIAYLLRLVANTIELPDMRNARGRRERSWVLPINDGRAVSSAPVPPSDPTPAEQLEANVKKARDLAVSTLKSQHGFSEVVYERLVDGRPGINYLGTPSIPASAAEIVIVLMASPDQVTAVGIKEVGWDDTVWGAKAHTSLLKSPAERFRGKQVFGQIRPKPGISALPLYVMVFAR